MPKISHITYYLSLVFVLLTLAAAETPQIVTLRDALAIGKRVRSRCPPELLFESAKNKESELAGTKLRVIRGRHLHLITDLPSSKEIDRLPQLFDAAVPLWAEYFRLDNETVADWKMLGVLVGESKNFASTTLLSQAPKLRHGFSLGNWLWIREQETDYYRRHLLLHEGVHGLMNHFFGSCGPNWYMEGLAELLGTHSWDEKTEQLTLPYFPENRDTVPLWGRIRILNDLRDENRSQSLESIFTMPFDGEDNTPSYAWSWGLAAFLDGHPLYADILRDAIVNVSLTHDEFTKRFRLHLESIQGGRACADWNDYLAGLEYGYDFLSNAIEDMTPGKPLRSAGRKIVVQAGLGWQNTGLLMEKGKTYSFAASGRFQLGAEGGKIWWSEPNGVTIRYHQGRPLGLLLGATLSEQKKGDFHSFPIGDITTWTAPETGTLFLRINDAASQLRDNSGTVAVKVETVR